MNSSASPALEIRKAPENSFIHVGNLPGSPMAARKAASRAALAGQLIQVRKGLYFRGAASQYGMTGPDIKTVALEVLGEIGVGPAGYSAARVWEATSQLPAVLHLATLFPTAKINGVVQTKRSNRHRTKLNYREIALLELLRDPDAYIEIEWLEFVERVRRSFLAGEINLDQFREAVAGEHSKSVRTNFEKLIADLVAFD